MTDSADMATNAAQQAQGFAGAAKGHADRAETADLSAQTAATNSQVCASTATDAAQQAQGSAGAAKEHAGTAKGHAGTAKRHADRAETASNSAQIAANSVQAAAEAAALAAQQAYSSASIAKQYADRAQNVSNNAQIAAQAAPGAAPAQDDIGSRKELASETVQHADLLGRMTELEAEVARLRLAAQAASTQIASSQQEPFTPPYVARGLVAVEGHLADMDRFAAIGDEMAAQQSKVAAAMRSCSTLQKLCDDDDFLQMLVNIGTDVDSPNTAKDRSLDRIRSRDFRDTEIELLQLAGLPEILAQAHIDEAIEAFEQNPQGALRRLRNPMTFLVHLRQLRDASCLTADLLTQSIRQQQTRQRWKKLLTFGLSGTLIVAVNSIGTVLLGPGGAAASGAIGSAAVGVAVQILS